MDAGAESSLERRVQVVSGKGGVGRTTVAAALALRCARQGAKTLLLEVDAPDSATRLLGFEPARDEPREVIDHLWCCNMTPAGSVREYALMVLRFKALYRVVFENRLVKYLLRSIPSLGEFTMAGKFWFHTVQTLDGVPRFDRVILDAPATGHAITFLAVSRVVAELTPPGPMKTEASKMAAMIEDPKNTCMHVVARPEEMPVNEALELEQAAVERVGIALGLGFLNRVEADPFTPQQADLVRRLSERHPEHPILHIARLRCSRQARSEREAERLRSNSRMEWLELPDLAEAPRGKDGLRELCDPLDRQLGAAEGPARNAGGAAGG